MTLWIPLAAGFGVVYHPNPLEAKTIGELCRDPRRDDPDGDADVLLGVHPEVRAGGLRQPRYPVVGAEKLREPVAQAFDEKFGIRPLEGYGCTELSPVVAVNVPDVNDHGEHQVGFKAGSVGHPLPGVVAKSWTPRPAKGRLDREGLLLVNGPN